MEVLAKSQLCIPNTPSTEQGSLQFQVIEGGSLLDISLRVETANGGVVRKKLAFFNKRTDAMNLREGFVEWEVDSLSPHQVYQVCFDNTMSRWTDKTVRFVLDFQFKVEDMVELNDQVIRDGFAWFESLGIDMDQVADAKHAAKEWDEQMDQLRNELDLLYNHDEL